MYFAWLNCDAITCAPLVIIVLGSIFIPIAIGGVIAWVLSGWFLKRVNNKRQTPLSSRKTLLFRAGSLLVVAGTAIFVWWLPNSTIITGIIFDQAKIEVSESYLFLPESSTPNKVTVSVKKYGFQDDAYYEAKSSHTFMNEEVIIEEEKSNPLFSKKLSEYEKDDSYDCFEVSEIASYCKAKFNKIYHTDISGKRLVILTDLTDRTQIDTFIKNLKQRKINTIDNLTFTERSY